LAKLDWGHRRHFDPNGCRAAVSPDGSEIVPTSKAQPDGTLVKTLARAWRWQSMLDDGVYTSVSDIGDAENISVRRRTARERVAPDEA
jgi:hypothetical protein